MKNQLPPLLEAKKRRMTNPTAQDTAYMNRYSKISAESDAFLKKKKDEVKSALLKNEMNSMRSGQKIKMLNSEKFKRP